MFEEYVSRFMRKHLIQWKNQEVFYGGDIVLAFYNDILKKDVCTRKSRNCLIVFAYPLYPRLSNKKLRE